MFSNKTFGKICPLGLYTVSVRLKLCTFFYRNKFRPTANETNQVQKHPFRPTVPPPSAQQDIEGDVFLTGEISKKMKCLMFVSFSPHHAAAPVAARTDV